MTLERITELQNKHGMTQMQNLIESGEVWKFEGSMGRKAMSLLESGACFLPEEDTQDYYGNIVPSRNRLQEGTKGTLGNSQNFWQGVEDGVIEIDYPDPEPDEMEEDE
jgi:hypothetical protein